MQMIADNCVETVNKTPSYTSADDDVGWRRSIMGTLKSLVLLSNSIISTVTIFILRPMRFLCFLLLISAAAVSAYGGPAKWDTIGNHVQIDRSLFTIDKFPRWWNMRPKYELLGSQEYQGRSFNVVILERPEVGSRQCLVYRS